MIAMTIEEAKEAREILSKTIKQAIDQFELATGMSVDAIDISKITFLTSNAYDPTITTINVKVSL